MKKTVKKLSEDVIQDQNATQTPAMPASNQEVQNATEANMTNDMMADGTIAAEDPNAAAETPVAEEPAQPETFTPPMAGMIPAGWVNPKDLGQAIAMETGDVQPAETAQDVQTTEQEDSVAATPADINTEEPLVNTQVMESMRVTKDELNMILEYRKYLANKVKESKTARVGDKIKIIEMDDNHRYNGKIGIVKKVESGCIYGTWGKTPLLENVDSYKILNKKSMGHSLEVAEEDEKEDISAGAPNVTKIEPAPLTESEDIPEAEVNPVPAPEPTLEAGQEPKAEEPSTPVVEESPEKETLEDEDFEEETPEDDFEDGDLEDEDSFEDDFEDDDLLDRIDSFLSNDTDDEIARTAFENTADLLDNIFDSDDEEDEDFEDEEDQIDVDDLDFVNNEEDFDSDDFEDEDEDENDFDSEDFDDDVFEDAKDMLESRSRHHGRRMKEEIIYPAGSKPRRESFEREDNLVEAYKRQSYNKRKALEEYRKSLRESSYDKALRGTSRFDENEEYDEKSWRANKLREDEKLNYKELLNNGFLG